MDRHERFAAFIEALMAAPAASTIEDARMLLERALNDIEDRYSGVEFDPGNWRHDGRLYPPQDDREIEAGVAGVRTFKTVGHYVSFGANGSIRIAKSGASTPAGAIVLEKPGADGQGLPEGNCG